MYDHMGRKDGYSNLWINYDKFKYLLNAGSNSQHIKFQSNQNQPNNHNHN